MNRKPPPNNPMAEWKKLLIKEADTCRRLKNFHHFAATMPGGCNLKEIKQLATKAINRARYYEHMIKKHSPPPKRTR